MGEVCHRHGANGYNLEEHGWIYHETERFYEPYLNKV